MAVQEPTRIVIIGATSAIAQEVAKLYAVQGARIFCVARDEQKVMAVASDLRARGSEEVSVYVADLLTRDLHADIVARSKAVLGTIDCVLVAHGVLPDQQVLDHDVDATIESFMINAVSVISISHRYAEVLEQQGSGSLVGISSVAGERGRASNYAYGAAKAAMTAFYSGLAVRLRPKGVHVLTVKPGPVDTPMTRGITMPLMVPPRVVAADIVRATSRRAIVLYTPGVWRFIMAIVRAIPNSIFVKMTKF